MADLAAPRPRGSWSAALLTVLLPGLGQLYAGRPRRALLVLLMDALWATYMLQLFLRLPEGRNVWLPATLYWCFRALEAADAVWVARRAAGPPRWFQRWYVYALCVLVLGWVHQFAVYHAGVRVWRVPTRSMTPTLLPGDLVLTDQLTRILPAPLTRALGLDDGEPGRGQIFGYRDTDAADAPCFISRVLGLPGDTIEVRAGHLWINGEAREEPYLDPEPDRSDYGPVTVPAGTYFVLGDHRASSRDSRYRDEPFLPRSRFVARARVIFASENPMTGEARWERCGRVLR